MSLAIDLDGTLANWLSDHAQMGDWKPGARDAVQRLRDDGHKIIVHSCRSTWDAGGGVAAIARFLRAGGFIPFAVSVGPRQNEEWRFVSPGGHIKRAAETDGVVGIDVRAIGIWVGKGKPIAHYYIDDRAIRFKGNWQETLDEIRTESGALWPPQ
jgi:hypothetical protein